MIAPTISPFAALDGLAKRIPQDPTRAVPVTLLSMDVLAIIGAINELRGMIEAGSTAMITDAYEDADTPTREMAEAMISRSPKQASD